MEPNEADHDTQECQDHQCSVNRHPIMRAWAHKIADFSGLDVSGYPFEELRLILAAPDTAADMYQPKTGAMCSCRKGTACDNCAACEGTGMVIDFAAIRARRGA